MELDARRLPDGAKLEADVCIVGAGPAGITLGAELMGTDLDLLLLESGGLEPEGAIEDLNQGAVVGDPYAGLRDTRHRGAGGAVRIWNTPVRGEPGAKYVPLDPGDFEARAGLSLSGWPFDHSRLTPFYRRAQAFCGLGPFDYGGEAWAGERRRCLTAAGGPMTTGVYQFGEARRFTEEKLGAVRGASNIRFCHHATVCALETTAAGRQVTGAEAASLSRKGRQRFQVRAPVFVLAGGAVENARLLLLSGGNGAGGPGGGDQHGWVGRCFMEHPRDYALTLVPRSPELFAEAGFYDAHVAGDGTMIGGRLVPETAALRAAGLPNASLTLLPRERRGVGGSGGFGRLFPRLRRPGGRRPVEGYGWSELRDPAGVFDAFQVIVNLEQRPHPENRVVLAGIRDPLGVPRVELHWRWRAEEQAELERLRGALGGWLEDSGLGRVWIQAETRPDPNAHHHAGTTRMHTDPRHGVVDADSRVHGTDNLYVTGASVFPTAGFANPTLTIVALALRLADHLKQRV